jgi:hypothetical protein
MWIFVFLESFAGSDLHYDADAFPRLDFFVLLQSKLSTTTLRSKMRIHPRLLMATPTTAGTVKGFKPAPLALLPPIPLYRRLFRAHRKFLPREMRLLGDEYIKAEFRAHRNVENPVHIV